MNIKLLLFCLLFAINLIIPTTIKAQATDVNDSLALVDLYNSTNGTKWFKNNNWLTTKPVSTWYGITVIDARVTRINIEENNLVNILPPSIGNLVKLTYLDLAINKLTGTIPPSIGNLVNLEHLNLAINKLSDSIPSSLGNLVNLEYLSLYNCYLSGSIPSSLGNLSNLNSLDLTDNQLSGPIPASFGNLIDLTSLSLSYNQLSGIIPYSFGNLINLNYLYLKNNQLSGSVPIFLGNLVNLYYLDLSYNQLSDTIPAFLGNLVNLYYLDLSYNQLSGIIPYSFGNLINLNYLYLNNNQLNGAIPSSLSNLVKLVYLYLNSNQLSDSIPASFGSLVSLNRLFLHYNQLSSTIPYSIGSLPDLRSLDLSHNRLSGTIPSSISSPPKLSFLNLSINQFTFAGMENVAQNVLGASYAPQANIQLNHQYALFSVSVGGTSSNNTYHWYKNDSLVAEITGDSTFIAIESGSYHVAVTNSIATKLTLYTDTISLNVLPVSFLSFTGRLQGNNAVLQWTTAQEYNASYFNILRSEDGTSFNTVAQVTAQGNHTNANQYSYTDKNISSLNASKLYYRLEEVDKDGRRQLSSVKVIDLKSKEAFTVYPNPATNTIQVQVAANALITITNTAGKVILTKVVNNNETINVSTFANGTYYVQNKTTGEVQKIVLMH